jgi:hypothetical protein
VNRRILVALLAGLLIMVFTATTALSQAPPDYSPAPDTGCHAVKDNVGHAPKWVVEETLCPVPGPYPWPVP